MSDISTRFKEPAAVDHGFGTGTIVILVVAIAIVAAAIYYFVIRPKNIDHSPTGLLGELCRAQGLNSSSSRLLNDIAIAAGLQHPAEMLLGRANFRATVRSAESKIELDRNKKNRLGMLQRTLFDESSSDF